MAVRVRVEGTDRVFDAAPGDDLLEVLQSHDEPIATSCGGVASCGLCRVTVASGREALVPIKPQELVHLGSVSKVLGFRLACQARVSTEPGLEAEVVVRIPTVEDVAERKRKKAERARTEPRPSHARSAPPPAAAQPRLEWRPGRASAPQNGPEGKSGT